MIKKYCSILVLILLIVTVIFGVKAILNQPSKTPDKVVLSFLDEFKQNDLEKSTKNFISFKQDEVMKALEPLKKDGILFDLKYNIINVTSKDNVAFVSIFVWPAKDIQIEHFEDLQKRIDSWGFYLRLSEKIVGFAADIAKQLPTLPEGQQIDSKKLKVDSWNFILVKNGDWFKGYEWEIIEAPEFTSLVSGIILYNNIVKQVYSYKESANRDSKRLADIKQLALALDLYFGRYKKYPTNLEELETEGYIPKIPKDPLIGSDYLYAISRDKGNYHLGVKLEDPTNIALKNDLDFSSLTPGFINGFNGKDPVYDTGVIQ